MATATRPTKSGVVDAPSSPSVETPKSAPARTNAEGESSWEYYLLCIMILTMVVMWGIMILDLFGSGFWVVFDVTR